MVRSHGRLVGAGMPRVRSRRRRRESASQRGAPLPRLTTAHRYSFRTTAPCSPTRNGNATTPVPRSSLRVPVTSPQPRSTSSQEYARTPRSISGASSNPTLVNPCPPRASLPPQTLAAPPVFCRPKHRMQCLRRGARHSNSHMSRCVFPASFSWCFAPSPSPSSVVFFHDLISPPPSPPHP